MAGGSPFADLSCSHSAHLERRTDEIADPAAPTGAQTIDRGLRVLWHLAEQPGGAILATLSRDLDMTRTALHRLMETFRAHDIVRRDENKRFHLSYGLVQLASHVDNELHRLAYPVMAQLADATGGTAHIMVPTSEVEVQAISVVEPRNAAVHLAFRTGHRHPIDRGSGGVAILAARPPRDDDSEEVREARRLGYALSFEQIIPGVAGVSVPLSTPTPMPEACIGISLVDRNAAGRAAPLVVAAARELSSLLYAHEGGR